MNILIPHSAFPILIPIPIPIPIPVPPIPIPIPILSPYSSHSLFIIPYSHSLFIIPSHLIIFCIHIINFSSKLHHSKCNGQWPVIVKLNSFS